MQDIRPESHATADDAGIIGAIVNIGKRWIESDVAEPVEKVVEIALPFTR